MNPVFPRRRRFHYRAAWRSSPALRGEPFAILFARSPFLTGGCRRLALEQCAGPTVRAIPIRMSLNSKQKAAIGQDVVPK
jgi:hypothetical protein